MEQHPRGSELVAGDFEFRPVDPVAKTRPQRLEDRLLGRESDRQAFGFHPTSKLGVRQLSRSEAPGPELISVLGQHLRDSSDLDEIDAMTDNAHTLERYPGTELGVECRRFTVAADDHQDAAARHVARRPVRVAILTVSDTRDRTQDASGDLIEDLATTANCLVARRDLVTDEPALLNAMLDSILATDDVDALLITGGTGVSPRDRTVDLVKPRLSREIPGYGESLRARSLELVGPAGLLSRAVAGVVDRPNPTSDVVVFTMPGSPNGVDTAMRELVLPLLDHLVWELRAARD